MAGINTVPAKAVTEDHRLEESANKTGEALAQHRWHWTLDESNPQRVSVSDYARAVARGRRTIGRMVNGYVLWSARALHDARTLQEFIDLQNVKQADQEIVTAVAKATGTSVNDTRNRHKDDVVRVRNAVADAREREPDLTPDRETEVVERTAKFVAAGRKAEKAKREQRRKSTPMQVLVVEGDLMRARDALTKALSDSHDLDLDGLDDELVDGLRDAINRVVALAQLVQSALGNVTDVDWDDELKKVLGSAS